MSALTQGMTLRFGKGKRFTTVPVETLNQASAIWLRFIEDGNGGELIFNPYAVAA